jgi:hypothetical protein
VRHVLDLEWPALAHLGRQRKLRELGRECLRSTTQMRLEANAATRWPRREVLAVAAGFGFLIATVVDGDVMERIAVCRRGRSQNGISRRMDGSRIEG